MEKVAIVDDDSTIVDVFSHMLSFYGYEPSPYTDPSEALAKIPHEDPLPSLILLDLMMVPITGFQFLEERRKNELLKEIPVLIVSAWDVPEEDRHKYAADYSGIIKKPIFPKDMNEKIRNVLGRRDPGKDPER
jgi:CheY-like chemotaxis protein